MDNNSQSGGKVRHITFGLVLAWIVGVLFGLSGIAMLFQHEAGAGIVFILAALVALPPVNSFVKSRTNFSLSGGLRATAVIVLLVIGGTLLSQEQGSSPTTVATATTGSTTVQATAEQPAAPAQAPIKVSAIDLYNAYNQNQVAADAKYKGNLVEMTGVIGSIGKDILNNPYVTLSTGEYSILNVQCMFSQADESQLANLSSGQSVTLEGTVSGETIGIVEVDWCSIVSGQ